MDIFVKEKKGEGDHGEDSEEELEFEGGEAKEEDA